MCQPPPFGVLSAARMQPARARRQWRACGHELDVHLEDISSFVQSGVSDSVVGDGISPSKEGWSKVCRIVSDVGRRSMHCMCYRGRSAECIEARSGCVTWRTGRSSPRRRERVAPLCRTCAIGASSGSSETWGIKVVFEIRDRFD